MTEERWQRLMRCTWFRQEQDEVTAYVEELRKTVIRLTACEAAFADFEKHDRAACPRCSVFDQIFPEGLR